MREESSENDDINALLSKGEMGNLDELERLYGADFAPSGRLNFSAHSDAELDNVPAIIRQKLAHYGYQHFGTTGNCHTYKHPDGHDVHIVTDGQGLHWAHGTNGVQTNPVRRQSGYDLIHHLQKIHDISETD